MVSSPQLFTARKFLLAQPDNHQLAELLVDALNNLVQYQAKGNTQLLYSLVLRGRVVTEVLEPAAVAMVLLALLTIPCVTASRSNAWAPFDARTSV